MSNVLTSVSVLKRNADFNVFVEYLREEKASIEKFSAVMEDEVKLRWMQGEAQRLNRILNLIDHAEEKIKELKEIGGTPKGVVA